MRPARREAPAKQPAKPTFKGVARRDPRQRLDLQIRFRGGAEAWVLVESRGRTQAFPGHWSVYDVLMYINGRSHHSID